MSESDVLVRKEGRTAVITLNRPQALNAMTTDLMSALGTAFDTVAADTDVAAIVLTGSGRGFCSGADLAASAAKPTLDAEGRLDLGAVLQTHYNPLIRKMQALPKPIIAAVNGMAAGAGAGVALMADLTIAARDSYFLQAFVNVGLIPDAGCTWILPQALGPQRAMGLALLGERLPAETAKEWGLIWDVADAETLLPNALALAERLAAGPTLAIARIKKAIHAAADNDLPTQLDLERDLQRECGRTQDFMEGAAAFVQKRKANFRGK